MTASAPYRGRFAPSPTGPLHLGSLVAALGSWLFARAAGGEWLVRIEDIDPPRAVAGASDRQLAALGAFGMAPDGDVLYQSGRDDAYAAALHSLLERGDAFECRCSRSDLAASGGVHRRCVAGSGARTPAIRLRVADGDLAFDDALQGRIVQDVGREVGDVVLRRADGWWAYQLAVVVDDAAQGISDVVRGADLLDSTPRQILLQRALALPAPGYAHLPLLLDGAGNKLSKSLRALPLDPADPWPALASAWRFLGQDAAALTRAGTPEQALRRALPAFSAAAVPRVRAAAIAVDKA